MSSQDYQYETVEPVEILPAEVVGETIGTLSTKNPSFSKEFLVEQATLALLLQSQSNLLASTEANTERVLSSQKEEANRVISSHKAEIDLLSAHAEMQLTKLCFLEEREQLRFEADQKRQLRKEKIANQKRRAIRDGATFPELEAAIDVIDSIGYRSEYVRSRDKVCLLILCVSGIRVANLNLVTASGLSAFLSEEPSCHFVVNAIKTRSSKSYSTLLTRPAVKVCRLFKNDILTLLEGKEPGDLVITAKNKKHAVDRSTLTKSLNSILKATGKKLGKNLKSHSFRIGHITTLIETFGLMNAQELAGHQDPSTTVRYSRNKLSLTDLKSKMLQVDKQKFNRIPCHKTNS